jgi:hypothetical protein
MFLYDRKKAITTIMGRRKPDGTRLSGPASMKPEIVRNEDRELDGRHSAAQDALAAISEKSPAKFMEAMANFQDMHSSNKE